MTSFNTGLANTGLRLDGFGSPHYVGPMQRWFILLLLSLFALCLAGCGIKGNLKTPPPLWGDETVQTEDASETDMAAIEDETDDLTYGVDVAD